MVHYTELKTLYYVGQRSGCITQKLYGDEVVSSEGLLTYFTITTNFPQPF